MDVTTKDFNMLKEVVENYKILLRVYAIHTKSTGSLLVENMQNNLKELEEFVQWLEK